MKERKKKETCNATEKSCTQKGDAAKGARERNSLGRDILEGQG